jgi:hypothetical protein
MKVLTSFFVLIFFLSNENKCSVLLFMFAIGVFYVVSKQVRRFAVVTFIVVVCWCSCCLTRSTC